MQETKEWKVNSLGWHDAAIEVIGTIRRQNSRGAPQMCSAPEVWELRQSSSAAAAPRPTPSAAPRSD